MASGGDDLKVQIWDFHRQDQREPSCSMEGSMANIFNIAFSATNKYVFSGGADDRIMQYDFASATELMARSATPPSLHADARYLEHDASIRDISCHPYNDEIFMSASEDGRIVIYDARASSVQGEIQLSSEATGARFNPTMEHIFATSDKRRLQLRDARMAFGGRAGTAFEGRDARTAFGASWDRGGVVRTFHTRLTRTTKRGREICSPEVNSFTFDAEGQSIAATILHHYPVIYALSDPAPIAVCTSAEIPPELGGYSNSCTMKHGSFSGQASKGKYYAAGSDDFRGYVWRIPSVEELLEGREEVRREEGVPEGVIAYAGPGTNSKAYIPVALTKPVCQLTGHTSIVNSTLFHPTLPHIATAGIERDVLLHGPTPGSPCVAGLRRSPESKDVRRVGSGEEEGAMTTRQYLSMVLGIDEVGDGEMGGGEVRDREVGGGEADVDSGSRAAGGARTDTNGDSSEDAEADASERRTISMFDYILRREGHADVWEAEDTRVAGSGGLDSSEEEDSEEEEDDKGETARGSSSDDEMVIEI
ncbi:WD40 repeat-like protein [Schizophyllum commune H4-8]|nr:WD40 repeat-like protein [Schizophyllum commune H4-8]KAI5897082.1 WD40 repeat-like protein [Schizophyllum commune H4-8]